MKIRDPPPHTLSNFITFIFFSHALLNEPNEVAHCSLSVHWDFFLGIMLSSVEQPLNAIQKGPSGKS